MANMGSMRSDGATTVSAFRWRSGERLWGVQAARNAGHVAFLDANRVIVVGHRGSDLEVLSAATGAPLESWQILGAGSLGHGLDIAADGSVTVLDGAIGRLLRYKEGVRVAESVVLGQGSADSTLPE